MDLNMKFIGFAFIAVLIVACKLVITPVPTSGSKSDGFVELSYEMNMLEIATVDREAAQASAVSRCKSWGYSDAVASQSVKTKCITRDDHCHCT